jgi:hypothetical protein
MEKFYSAKIERRLAEVERKIKSLKQTADPSQFGFEQLTREQRDALANLLREIRKDTEKPTAGPNFSRLRTRPRH